MSKLGHVKGKTGGPDVGTNNQGVYHMTTFLSPITNFTTPMSGTFTRISQAISQYRAVNSQKARVAKHVELLSGLDSHMLNDIGMKGFNQLAPTQQECVLLDVIKHA
jgi:hypothetical protein